MSRKEQPESIEDEGTNLSEQEERFVKTVEELPIRMTSEKINTLLVLQELKPTAIIDFTLKKWGENQKEPEDSREEELQDTIKQLESLGLTVKTLNQYHPHNREHVQSLAVALGDKKAAELEDVYNRYQSGEKGLDEELGQILGYPGTASKAFAKYGNLPERERVKGLIRSEQLPDEIRNQDFMAFAGFILSQEHWEEEIETAKQWADEIRRLCPALYKERVRQYREDQER